MPLETKDQRSHGSRLASLVMTLDEVFVLQISLIATSRNRSLNLIQNESGAFENKIVHF